MPLSLRLCLCAAVCALTLACSGEAATSPRPRPRATTAAVAAIAPTSPPVAATQPAPTATPAPQPTAAPVATRSASGAPPRRDAGARQPAARAPEHPGHARDRDQTYEPHQIHGNYDDTVIVTIHGSDERHSFTVPVLGIDRVIEKGKTEVVTFVLPLSLTGGTTTPAHEGIYPFYCRFHGSPTSGMHGLLIFH